MKTSEILIAVVVGVTAAVIANVIIQKANLNTEDDMMCDLLREQNMLLRQQQQRYL